MAIVRWDPWSELARVRRELDSFFGERPGVWNPAADITREGDTLTMKIDLPGMKTEDITVELHDSQLIVTGERKLEKEERRENYHRLELSYGTFTRAFTMPATIDSEKIRAESKQGVLHIHLPKKPEAKPKSIQVKVS